MERPEGEEAEVQRKRGGRIKGRGKPELWITSGGLVSQARSLTCSAKFAT